MMRWRAPTSVSLLVRSKYGWHFLERRHLVEVDIGKEIKPSRAPQKHQLLFMNSIFLMWRSPGRNILWDSLPSEYLRPSNYVSQYCIFPYTSTQHIFSPKYLPRLRFKVYTIMLFSRTSTSQSSQGPTHTLTLPIFLKSQRQGKVV